MTNSIIIAGAGQAAAQAVVSLRDGGFTGAITLVGEEPYLPYQRPPLSKKYLSGEMELERLYLRPQEFYAEQNVTVLIGTRIESIDRDAKSVRIDDGRTLSYDRLILATGSHLRRLKIPGADAPEVYYLCTIDDVRRLQQTFAPGRRMVVIGAGFIGLEVAAVAVTTGLEVDVVEIADRVMARAVSPPISYFYQDAHEQAGVRFHLQTAVKEIRRAPSGVQVVCGDGSELPADIVLVGIGVQPNTALAEAAGLECSDGIVVDEYCCTSDPHIFAIGDCTHHPNTLLGRKLRLESMQNAQDQGKTAALAIIGRPQPYAQVPWFWSDQYDLKLQMAGLAEHYSDLVIRGDPASRSFAVFYFVDRRLIAVHAINSPREFMLSKKLIAEGLRLDPHAVADTSIPFKEVVEAARAA